MPTSEADARRNWSETLRPVKLRSWVIAALTLLVPLPALTAGGAELVPRCGGPFMLCGYVEKDSKEERIPQRFEVAKPFSEGLAAVRIKGRYGFIDTSGKIVIAARFQNAGPFAGKYAEISQDGASGIINRSGEIVVKPQFRRIIPFTGDTFVAQPFENIANKQGVTHHDQQLEAITEPLTLSSYNNSGLFHIQKGWLTAQNLQFHIFDKPERGLIWAENRSSDYHKTWGLMQSDGTWQVEPSYNAVFELRGTRAVVLSMPDHSLPWPQRRDAQRWGAVDRDGNLVIPLKFPFLRFVRGSYGIAKDGQPFNSDGTPSGAKEGIVRPDGTLLADRYFDKVEISDDGKLLRGRVGKIWYNIEPDGRMIPDLPDTEKLLFECPGGLSIVERSETVEFRKPGEARPLGLFDKGFFLKRDCQKGFSATRGGKWFILFEDGTVLGGKNGFENTYSFSGNHTAVQVDGKWGIIDRSGAFTVKPSFDMLRPASKDTFTVDEGKDPYWIDAFGNRAEKPPKEITLPIERLFGERALNCPGGLRFFEKAGLWGLQDSGGKTIIKPQFRALSCFKEGVTWTAAPDGKAWCPIGSDGQRHKVMECRKEYYVYYASHSKPEFFSADPYENSVLWNRAFLGYLAGKRNEPPEWKSIGRRR